MASLAEDFGSRLRELRGEVGMRVSDVADQIGVTASFLRMLEAGTVNTSFEKIERLAVVLQIDVADLFTFPTRGTLRQRARELIRSTPNAKIGVLVEAMEQAAGAPGTRGAAPSTTPARTRSPR
jgi:transcriptional regulator with XRE-family HTH domain